MKKLYAIVLFFIVAISSCNTISAIEKSKMLKSTFSTTTVRVTGRYYTNEVTRWKIDDPLIESTGGKGGATSKNGKPTTSQSGTKYYVKQNINISATDNNYSTTSIVKNFTWCMNGSTNNWVDKECKVS